jgi:acyl-CoA synthetase (AMP-forming)/AMP-acid ligase II
MIHDSLLPDVEIPDLPVTRYVLDVASRCGDKAAMIDGLTGRTVTYAQLVDAVRRMAAGLSQAGLVRGEVLALVSGNCPEYPVIFHAAASVGAIVMGVNPWFGEAEMRRQLLDSRAVVLVAAQGAASVALAAAVGTGVRTRYVFNEAHGVGPDADEPGLPDAVEPAWRLLGEAVTDPVSVDPADVAALAYSSGTTGDPKGVMLTHRNLVATIAQYHGMVQPSADDVTVAVPPFFHVIGLTGLNLRLCCGSTTVTVPGMDLGEVLQAIQTHRATVANVYPPMVQALAQDRRVDSYDLTSLKLLTVGGGPFSADMAAAAGTRLGCHVPQGYGMTETLTTHLCPPGGIAGAVGVALAEHPGPGGRPGHRPGPARWPGR